MSQGWLVGRAGSQYGPYTWVELVAAARNGRVVSEDLVWHPSLPGWVRAGDVPGLLTEPFVASGWGAARRPRAGGSPPRAAESRRRGPLWLWVALSFGVCAVAVVVAIMLVRQPASKARVVIEEIQRVTVTGTVSLPPGCPHGVEEVRVLSNLADAAPARGRFALDAAILPTSQTLVAAVGPQGQLLLLGTGSGDLDAALSVQSTARALVLYDPAILGLPAELAGQAERLAEEGGGLDTLAAMIADSLRRDSSRPLDADAHPEIYEEAARLTAHVLDQLVVANPEVARPGLPLDVVAATGSPALTASGRFVSVEDDPGHSTPDVFLTNHTFAYYDVEWAREVDGKVTKGHAVLPRCRPYNLQGLQFGWPPASGFVKTRALPLGDGRLDFSFHKNEAATAFDAGIMLVCSLLGFGANRLPSLGVDCDAMAAAAASIAGTQAFTEWLQLFKRTSGTITWSEAFKEIGGFLAVNGVRLSLALAPLVCDTGVMKEEFVKVLGVSIAKKPIHLALLGYGAFDVAAMVVDGRNPAFDSYQTGGVQLAGIYPLEVGLSVEELGMREGAHVFRALIEKLPYDFRQPLRLTFRYGDGTQEEVSPNVEAGGVPVAVAHKYQQPGAYELVVELETLGSPRIVLAAAALTVEADAGGEAGTDGDPLAAPFPNGFIETGRQSSSSHGWTYRMLGLQREGSVSGVFTWSSNNPLSGQGVVVVGEGSMPCVYTALVALVEPRGGITSWGGAVRGGIVPDEVALDPEGPFYNLPLEKLVFDAGRDLYYASPHDTGRQLGVALLRSGQRLVLIYAGYHIPEDVIRAYRYPEGANGFDPTGGDDVGHADCVALVEWIRARLGDTSGVSVFRCADSSFTSVEPM